METKLFLTGLLLSLTTVIFPQKIIKVQGQHSKKIIYTFKADEQVAVGEAKMFVKNDGLNYEFIISNYKKSQNTLYKNGQKLGTFPTWYYRFSDFEYWYEFPNSENSRIKTLCLKNGKKYGSFEELYTITDYKNNVLKGYAYSKDKKQYLHYFPSGKTYGPYDSYDIRNCNNNQLVFSYKIANQYFIYNNGEVFGPYRQVKIPYYYGIERPFHFTYQKEDSDFWYVYYEKELEYQFTGVPDVQIFQNNKVALTGRLADGVEYLIFEGKKYVKENGKIDAIIDTKGVNVLVLKYEDPNKRSLASLYYNDVLLGKFEYLKMYASASANSSFVNGLFVDKNESGTTYYGFNGKLCKLFDKKSDDNYEIEYVGEDCYFFNKSDSILYKNGSAVHQAVVYIDEVNGDLLIRKQNQQYEEFYSSTKKLNAEDMKKLGYHAQWYNMKDNPYSFTRKDDKTYIKAKNASRSFEVYGRYNEFAFSSDQKHLLECVVRRMEIYLDNKYISTGYCIAYSSAENCYYWISSDKKHLYLHTYHLN